MAGVWTYLIPIIVIVALGAGEFNRIESGWIRAADDTNS
jgi:hypothetical protein